MSDQDGVILVSRHGCQRGMVLKESGFVLVTVLLVGVVVSLLVLAASFTALADLRVAASQRGGTEAYYVAQAGLERLKTGLFLALEPIMGTNEENVCSVDESTPLIISIGDGLEVEEAAPTANIPFGRGNYVLLFTRDGNRFVLTSVGRVGSSQSTVQVVATAGGGAAGVWDNAVYAREFRDRQGNRTITGNVAAFGSVHIVNGDLEADRFRDEALDLSGTAGMFNNYFGDATGSATDVTVQTAKALGAARAEAVIDLCAQLKIARGDVVLGGNADLGADPDRSQPGYENRIEGVYLGDGEVKTTGSSQVFARSDVDGYDGFDLPFPPIGNDFPNDLDASSQVKLSSATDCALIQQRFSGTNQRTSLFIPPESRDSVVICPPDADTSDPDAHFVMWDGTRGTDGELVISGNVAVPNHNVEVLSDITYSGTGVFRIGVPGAGSPGISISGQILPSDPARYLGKGAGAIGLGIVSAGEVTLRGNPGSRPTIAALIYSADLINVRQTYTVVGALVGDGVFTDNVPMVAYHPDVRDFAEVLCLPGTLCDNEGVFGNAGFFRDISVERR